MPRAAADTVKSDNGSMQVKVTLVGQPSKDGQEQPDKEVEYSVPSNGKAFQDFILGMSPGETLDAAFEDYCKGVRSRVRTEAYEAVQSESTWITIGKDANGNAIRKDLLTFPLANFVKSYNFQYGGLSSKAEMLTAAGTPTTIEDIDRGFGSWRAAARKHAEAGKVKIGSDGVVTVV